MVYLDADSDDRLSRSGEGADSLRERDRVKRDRGADHVGGIADWVLDNSGSLVALKLATARLASAHAGDETPSVSTATLEAPAAVQEWIDEAVHRLVDSSVAAVLATGSTGQAHWRDGWSDIDLLVIRDTLPLRWIRGTVTSLGPPDGVKAGVSLFTTDEIVDYRVPPRVIHALRLACRDGRGVLFLRDGFDLPAPRPSLDERASRRELPQVVMTLRRLVTADPLDVRAVYKHIMLVMKILLRADGIDAETSDEVQQQFSVAHPAAAIALPTLQEMAPQNSQERSALAVRVLAAADSLLRYHDSLGSTLTPLGHQR